MSRQVVNGVLYGASEAIVEMVRQRIPAAFDGFTPHAVGLGVVRNGLILGGVVFDQYTETEGQANIVMSGAFDSPRWASRATLRQLFIYPFIQLGCRRMTTITRADNERALKLDEGLGFKREGVLRCLYPGDVDGIVLGMLREECKWLGDINEQ